MTRRNKHIGIIALFVLPALFFYGTFNVVGIVRTFFYSFMDWKGISANRTFIGLGNVWAFVFLECHEKQCNPGDCIRGNPASGSAASGASY